MNPDDVNLISDVFNVLGHDEYGRDLSEAFEEYNSEKNELAALATKVPVDIEDHHKLIKAQYSKYEDAYKKFCKSWNFHMGLISISKPKKKEEAGNE